MTHQYHGMEPCLSDMSLAVGRRAWCIDREVSYFSVQCGVNEPCISQWDSLGLQYHKLFTISSPYDRGGLF